MVEKKSKGLGLCRVSTIEQGRGTSLDSQEDWVIKKADEMGIELVNVIPILSLEKNDASKKWKTPRRRRLEKDKC